ncbi:energy transducer TonB [Hahella sp. SMD15-11]|uniref:Energy transducer TonB n=1 Tax=Thermohahella caldifontis TaxID=3142973 RepID=A0AB39UTM9_9GAMM
MKPGRLVWAAIGLSLALHAAVLGILPPLYPERWGEQGADVLSVTLDRVGGHPAPDQPAQETAPQPDASAPQRADAERPETARPVEAEATKSAKVPPASLPVETTRPIPLAPRKAPLPPEPRTPAAPPPLADTLQDSASEPPAQRTDSVENTVPVSPGRPEMPSPAPDTSAGEATEKTKTNRASESAVSQPPRYRLGHGQTPAPPYPYLARRMGWEGRVEIALRVDGQGNPLDARIVNSSGYPVLDQAALKTLKQWKLAPSPAGEETLTIGIEFRLR